MPLNARTLDGLNSFLTRGNGNSDESRIAMLRSSPASILAGPRLLTGLREYRAVIAENQSLFPVLDHAEGSSEHDEFAEDRYCHHAEKKRRLTTQQVKSLELSFKMESKLEPERKNKLALDLGLQPRQVAIWFQNRRARYKTKQLEQDFGILKQQYDAVCAEKRKLEAEVARLKGLLEEGSGDKLQPQPKEEQEQEREERWAARNKEQQPLEAEGGELGSRSDGGAGAILCNDNNVDGKKHTRRGELKQDEVEGADMVVRKHTTTNNTGSGIQICMERLYNGNPQVVQQIAMKVEEGCYVTEELYNHNTNSINYYLTLDDQTNLPNFCFDNWLSTHVGP